MSYDAGDFINSLSIYHQFDHMLLGSKDLGFNVFRTLMCNVGKP